jgi:hypothetical protein
MYRIPNLVPVFAFGPFPILCSIIVTPFANEMVFFSGLASDLT